MAVEIEQVLQRRCEEHLDCVVQERDCEEGAIGRDAQGEDIVRELKRAGVGQF